MRRIDLEPIKRMWEIVIEEVTVEGLLLQMIRTQIFSER